MSTKLSLYDLNEEVYNNLKEIEEHCILNDTDEVPDELMERFFINRDELAQKLYGYYMYSKDIEARAQVLKDEAARLLEKAATMDKTAKRLMTTSMEAVVAHGEPVLGKDKMPTGSKKFKNDKISLTVVFRESVDVYDPSMVDPKYIHTELVLKKMTESQYAIAMEVLKENIVTLAVNKSSAETISKTLIKKDLKSGNGVVDGAELIKKPSMTVR